MDKLIFLDIDGVVNTLMISDQPFEESERKQIARGRFYFDLCSPSDKRVSNKQAVMWLNKLCLDANAKIVISSTWRAHMDVVEESLRNSGLFPEIEIIGATPHLGERRGVEILDWLNKHYPDKHPDYVILDDDNDMDGCMEHLVLCGVDHGFGYTEYYKAMKILKIEK